MTVYATTLYAQNQPPNTGHGFNTASVHLHAVSGSIAALVTADTINIGYIPNNAVVVSCYLKAASQLDSGAGLTLSVGTVGTPTLFKNAVTTVGRAAGASADITVAAAGLLYKNTSGAKQAIVVTATAGAATPVAGTVELDMEFYVEDTVGSQA